MLPLKKGLKLIGKAQEEDTREFYYRWWLARYPLYDNTTYETFEEFYEKYGPKSIAVDMRPKEELIKEILEIEGRR